MKEYSVVVVVPRGVVTFPSLAMSSSKHVLLQANRFNSEFNSALSKRFGPGPLKVCPVCLGKQGSPSSVIVLEDFESHSLLYI